MSHVLLGEWGFLDNLDDTSGNGITASANFSPSFVDGPAPGTRGVRFSGAGQTITYGRAGLEPVASAGGIVTMVWAKLFSAHSNYTQLIHKTRASDSTRHAIDASDNSVFTMSRWRDQIAFRESGGEFLDLGWHHICNVDSDDRYAWFIDGVLIQEASRSGTGAVSWEDFPWVSGKDPNMADSDSSASVAFTGVRILSGTLTNLEVVGWMNTPIVSGPSGMPKVWNGTDWVKHHAKVWNGSAWVPASMAGYDGTEWVVSR
jgi:hypothetical protein